MAAGTVYDAMEALETYLTLAGFPRLNVGVPEGALRGETPNWYMDMPHESRGSALMQAVGETDTLANIPLYVVVDEGNKPADERTFWRWMTKTLVPAIVQKVIDLTTAETFASAGAGSRVEVVAVDYDYIKGKPIATIKLTLEVSAYAS